MYEDRVEKFWDHNAAGNSGVQQMFSISKPLHLVKCDNANEEVSNKLPGRYLTMP